jgi:peptide-methionine (S)-S-oxide reductase
VTTDSITLAGGCFWCIEAVFREVRGVVSAVSGYAGGRRPNPTYEQVCTGVSGHAEVVQVTFQPDVIGLRDLLRIFFAVHDPTTVDRQGADEGPQYRSSIFYKDEAQKALAAEVIAELTAERIWPDPIVTRLEPLTDFFPAEAHHQDYYARNGRQPYCQVVIAPKLAKFRTAFADRRIRED